MNAVGCQRTRDTARSVGPAVQRSVGVRHWTTELEREGHRERCGGTVIETEVEIVHSHGFKSDVVAYLAAMGLPVKLVSTTHGWCAREGLRIRLYEAIGRLALRRFDRVYSVSSAQALELKTPVGLRFAAGPAGPQCRGHCHVR